ncbi:hypothetical protein CH75_20460 [Dyella jiangningensis]|nr:hypothetical protein CH75_20460 [Dyella jiangningensis]
MREQAKKSCPAFGRRTEAAAPRDSLRSQASQFAITNDQRAGRLYRMPNMKTARKAIAHWVRFYKKSSAAA